MQEIFAPADGAIERIGIPDGFPSFVADFAGTDATAEMEAALGDFMSNAVSNLVSAGVCAKLIYTGEDLMAMGAPMTSRVVLCCAGLC